jgi:amidase
VKPWFAGDATALAQAVGRGEFSAAQALQRTLQGLRGEGAALNGVALWCDEVGFEQAHKLDAELAGCADDAARAALLQRRPFFGVPLLLKDVGPATAHPRVASRMGSRLFGQTGHAWPQMGTLTQRYLDAGFVPFGRSTSPEMGISASTEAVAYGGPTRNPWNLAHSAGGSSGGAAALTAAGLVSIAHANDGAGSIRIPASCCGLIGLKPSRGLMPMGPLAGEAWGGVATDHMLTRSVRDCALALDVSAGSDPGAPYAAPARPTSFVAAMHAPLRPLRIALCASFFEGDAVHVDVERSLRTFAVQLQELGHHVEEARPPLATLDVLRPLMQVVAAGTAMTLQGIASARGRPLAEDEVEPATFGAFKLGQGISGAQLLAAIHAMHMLARRMAVFHERFDMLLTPVLAEPPALLGRFAMHNPDFNDYRLGPAGLWRYSPFAPLANATGAPALSLPAPLSSSGLPIGAMLSASLGEDALLLRLAAQWEAANQGGGAPVHGARP